MDSKMNFSVQIIILFMHSILRLSRSALGSTDENKMITLELNSTTVKIIS